MKLEGELFAERLQSAEVKEAISGLFREARALFLAVRQAPATHTRLDRLTVTVGPGRNSRLVGCV